MRYNPGEAVDCPGFICESLTTCCLRVCSKLANGSSKVFFLVWVEMEPRFAVNKPVASESGAVKPLPAHSLTKVQVPLQPVGPCVVVNVAREVR